VHHIDAEAGLSPISKKKCDAFYLKKTIVPFWRAQIRFLVNYIKEKIYDLE
jgi:hypothetical protein